MGKENLNIKTILLNSFRRIYDVGIYLILFELIYKGLMLILFKPALTIMVSLFIRARGYEILVNQDITQFLLSLSGLMMVVIVSFTAVILVFYEYSVILLILDHDIKNEKMNLLHITEIALLELKNVIKNKHIGLVLYMLVLIPILNIGISASLLPTLSIPDFITGEISKYPGSGLLYFSFAFFLVYLFAKLFIVLPLMILSDQSFNQAAKMSFKTIRGELFQIAFLIISAMLIWLTLANLPFRLLENAEFIVFRFFRSMTNISMSIFTLLISPFILTISLESYKTYVHFGVLKRQNLNDKIKLGYFGQRLWNSLEKLLQGIQSLLLKFREKMKAFIGVIFILIVAINFYGEDNLSPILERQLLIGHRGGEYGVENTIDTILYAGTHGADYVEMDVLLSSDHIPVVIHDNSLRRLANSSKAISDLTFEEMKEITIKAGDQEGKIPSLEELAEEVKGKTKLLLEFKTHGKETVSIVDKTVEILEEAGILEETIFHTSEYDIIQEFNEKHEELMMGYVFIGKIGTFSARNMSNLPVDFISAEESLINKNMIREVHRSGKPVFAWTINDDYKAETLFAMGVDGLITDYPIEFVELRDQYKEMMRD